MNPKVILGISIFVLTILCIPGQTSTLVLEGIQENKVFQNEINEYFGADIGDGGNALSVTTNMSREVIGLSLNISNSYEDLAHSESFDLSSYELPGWQIYRADLNMTDMSAIAERETLGVQDSANPISVENSSGDVIDSLTQAFYNQPYDGKLENYTISYLGAYYETLLGKAYLVVRSDYTDGSTNETSWSSPFVQTAAYTQYTHDVSSDNAILNGSTSYYVVIDGSLLTGVKIVNTWYFNTIHWAATDTFLGFDTQYNLRGDGWYPYNGVNRREANLNYTYTPWNKTSNSPLSYFNAEEVNLFGNSTQLSGTSWSFQNSNGIRSITLETNQSIDLSFDMIIWYQKDSTATTSWQIQNSGGVVNWNITFTVSYPSVSGGLDYYLNVSKPLDWTANGLYNSTNPSVNYGNYVDTGTQILCSSMTNGTWVLTNSAHNYVTNIQAPSIIVIDTTLNVVIDIEDAGSSPATSGSTNLTIQKDSTTYWNPANKTVITGSVTYSSSIDTWTSENGTYIIEVFWTNGTEAGYLTEEFLVYYPTSLTGDTQIEAYTDSSFEIRVDFIDSFSPTPLTATYADVVYSYDSGSNVSLTDLGNGTWRADISTAGDTAGLHSVTVYAEGYAIQNQSLDIDILLTYDSIPLSYNWTDPQENDISYLQNTNLTVSYTFVNGSAIPNAIVNITDGTTTWPMIWDPVAENYTIQFNGTDYSSLPITINLTVNAWKAHHEPQINSTIKLYISEETATSLSLSVTPSNLNITYVESLRFIANYSFDGGPITAATVTIQFNTSTPITMEFNASDGLWYAVIYGYNLGVGYWEYDLFANASGYLNRNNLGNLDIWEDAPVLEGSWEDLKEITDYDTNVPLSITTQDSLGNPIIGASVTATLLSSEFILTHTGNGIYTGTIIPEYVRGNHSVVVTLVLEGYETKELLLRLTILATTEIEVDILYSQYETENITISIGFIDAQLGTQIDWGSVNITIEDTLFETEYNGTLFVVSFIVDFPVGLHDIVVEASAEGANPATENTTLDVLRKSYVYITLSYSGSAVQGNTISVDALLRNNVTDSPIQFETIYFNITVVYENGTNVLSQFQDSTNAQGIASISFDIPTVTEAEIVSIDVEVFYDGDVDVWDVENTFSIPIGVDPLEGVLSFFFLREGRYVILGILLLGIVSLGYNKRIKPRKRAARTALDHQLKDFQDLQAVQHFMAVYLNRGTCVFYHPFKESRIQADLISGFISAVTTVYGEIKGDGVQGSLEEIQYQGLRLNSYSGKYVLGILILDDEISPHLRDKLTFFVELFENEYENHLDGWTGMTDCFDPEWIVSNLVSTLGYSWMLPHTVHPKDSLSRTEKKIVDYIQASLTEEKEFLISDYLEVLSTMFKKNRAEILDMILKLENRGVFQPISIHSYLQRQGMGLVTSEDDMDFVEIEESIDDADTEVEETHNDSIEEPSGIPKDEEEVVPATEEKFDETTEDDLVQEEIDEIPEKESEVSPETSDEEPADPKDEFLKEVEDLLRKEKENDSEK